MATNELKKPSPFDITELTDFALCPNEGERGPDRSPVYLRAAAKMLAGK